IILQHKSSQNKTLHTLAITISNMQSFKNLEKPLSEDKLKCLLKKYDKSGDGKLNKQELKVAFKDLGLWFCGLRAYQAMHHADKNNDGLIVNDEMDVLVEFATKWGFTLV
ncbi:hypothetical protein AABB24_019931, partial [Solanum stoloniferum]